MREIDLEIGLYYVIFPSRNPYRVVRQTYLIIELPSRNSIGSIGKVVVEGE